MAAKKRDNGEGSIYPHRNGFAAYAWVTTPVGKRTRKYVYGKTRDEVHDKWIKLLAQAKEHPIPTSTPKLGTFLRYWLEEVIKPNAAPLTHATNETFVRLHLVPALGDLRLPKLTVSRTQRWMNELARTCQCCFQGKDARRDAKRQRCCARGACCKALLSRRSLSDIRACLRNALSQAIREELVTRNVAALIKIPKVVGQRRARKRKRWTNAEAKAFLASAREDGDPLYAVYVLVVLLAMRKGEALGVPVDAPNFRTEELEVDHQLQRVGRQLLHRETKTEASEDTLPLPPMAAVALKQRAERRKQDRVRAGDEWQETGLLFTTRFGGPIEPRNLNRSWNARCVKAGVPRITVHDGRRSCGSLLVELDVHPRVIMRILRHAQMEVTMEIYSEVSTEVARQALRKLNDSLET
ncbi:site-specific integrase [Saccharothrix violaceirubra]|uniref:Integrase n=1 Tax=Saccharothrix violaceirubra TaxID=413306 RepID=A0A7W7TBY2_9PSEU|nr:site-specific integrase [Saccharothrix violaceirubra]MBB4968970.1 integrase [Saccharothrix violaceirubra]